ncbi:hypothetical protein J0H58_15340 [bacterium]|nr:hypothetical protein [bacterium]
MMRKYHVRFGGGPTEKESQDHLAGGLPNYGGSGPAQLALALAADVLGDDEAALGVYQRLKFRVVGRLPADGWTLTEAELTDAIRSLARPDGE